MAGTVAPQVEAALPKAVETPQAGTVLLVAVEALQEEAAWVVLPEVVEAP